MAKWSHVVEMNFEIELLDGTRFGAAGTGLEIGGVDLAALKDTVTGQPYIPGSSLKGKLRSTLEKAYGRGTNGEPCRCGEPDCPVCPIFGAHKNTDAPASRLIVRDAHFTREYAAQWEKRSIEGLPTMETKTENVINRYTGTAVNPRSQERVPPGATFAGAMVLKVFEGDDDTKMIDNLRNALAIIERFDALGAGGSRGSGRVRFSNFNPQKVALAGLKI